MPNKLDLLGSCYPGNRKLFVETNGQFYMCEKFGGRLSIGNVDIGIGYDSVNKIIDDFLDIRNNLCTKNCWAQRLCNPCIHSAKDPNSNISVNGLRQTCSPLKFEIITAISLQVALSQKNPDFYKTYIDSISIN